MWIENGYLNSIQKVKKGRSMKHLIVYGAGFVGLHICEILRHNGLVVDFIIDANHALWGGNG